MQDNNPANLQIRMDASANLDLKEIVMGLHWDPPEESVTAAPEDLDALCVLFDGRHRMLEAIHPGHPRNANGSLVHTGDSRTGASEWDDERIFVFLEALPKEVSEIAFVVASAKGRAFNEIRGASCHVSDRVTEQEWVRLDLTALMGQTAYSVAALHRNQTGWNISTNVQTVQGELLAELLSLVRKAKTQAS